jgi:hypothetical protein
MQTYEKVINYFTGRFGQHALNGAFQNSQPYVHISQGSHQWMENRKKNIITCSNIAKVIPGADPYMSRTQFAKVTLGVVVEQPVSDFAKKLMQHGTDWEDCARRIYWYFRKYGRICGSNQVLKDCYILETGTFLSGVPEIEFSGSPDGIYFGEDEGKPVLIEIKCPARAEIPNRVPFKYILQVLGLMGIMHLKICDFVYFIPGEKIRVFRVKFNQRAFDIMNQECNRWLRILIYDEHKQGQQRFKNCTKEEKQFFIDHVYDIVPQNQMFEYVL